MLDLWIIWKGVQVIVKGGGHWFLNWLGHKGYFSSVNLLFSRHVTFSIGEIPCLIFYVFNG
jgi:hypothetical protein